MNENISVLNDRLGYFDFELEHLFFTSLSNLGAKCYKNFFVRNFRVFVLS